MSTLRVTGCVVIAALAALAACSSNDDVPAPQLSGILPDHGAAGSIVMVDGSFLCQTPTAADGGEPGFACASDGTITFGATPADATSGWTDTSVMVIVPNGADGDVEVRASNNGRTSNSVTFTVD
jgi:hypothetical protein